MTSELDLWPRIEAGLRGVVPLTVTFTLVVLGATPLGLPALGPVMPMLPLMSTFYWVIYRPDLTPYVGTFFVGLFQDTLAGTPLGFSALVLVAVHAVMASQRRFFQGKSFLVLWFGFAVLAVGAMLMSWVLASALFGTLVRPGPVLFQMLLTIALFPCLTWVFRLIQRELLRPV